MKEIFKRYGIDHFVNKPDRRAEFGITRFDEMEEPDIGFAGRVPKDPFGNTKAGLLLQGKINKKILALSGNVG